MNIILFIHGFLTTIGYLFIHSHRILKYINEYFDTVQHIKELDKDNDFHNIIGGEIYGIVVTGFLTFLLADLALYNSSYFIENISFQTYYKIMKAIVYIIFVISIFYALIKKISIKYNYYDIYTFNGRLKAVKHGGTWLGAIFAPYWLFFNKIWLGGVFTTLLLTPFYFIKRGVIPNKLLNVETNLIFLSFILIIHITIGFFGNDFVGSKLLNMGYKHIGTIKSHSTKQAINDYIFLHYIDINKDSGLKSILINIFSLLIAILSVGLVFFTVDYIFNNYF